MKILLVDDDRMSRGMTRHLLRDLGQVAVEEARDGFEAVEILARSTPDLILLDWNMPGMDGITLLHRIRGSHGALPIIMVTTESRADRIVEAIRAGADDYVTKPFSASTLSDKIQSVCGQTARSERSSPNLFGA